MDEIFLFLLLGLCLLALHYAFDRWNSRAPAPDGLYAGERLISSMRAKVSIDGAFLAGEGFAYLTDLRLVWTPSIGNLRNVMVRGLSRSSLYEEPVVVEFPAIRKVDARFHLGGSRLVVETVDARIDLLVYGRSFGSWERYLVANARNLLPADQQVQRTHNRYSSRELLASSKRVAVFFALFLFYVGARFLDTVVDWQGDQLSKTQFIGVAVAVLAVVLAGFAWETRRR